MMRIPFPALAAALAGCTIAGPAGVPGGTAPVRVSIAYGQTVNGALEATDRLAEDNSFHDDWVFSGRAGETVEVTLQSDDFDAFLFLGRLRDGGWTTLATDDNGGGGTGARIVHTLPENGAYVVRANSLLPGRTGAYTLSLRRR